MLRADGYHPAGNNTHTHTHPTAIQLSMSVPTTMAVLTRMMMMVVVLRRLPRRLPLLLLLPRSSSSVHAPTHPTSPARPVAGRILFPPRQQDPHITNGLFAVVYAIRRVLPGGVVHLRGKTCQSMTPRPISVISKSRVFIQINVKQGSRAEAICGAEHTWVLLLEASHSRQSVSDYVNLVLALFHVAFLNTELAVQFAHAEPRFSNGLFEGPSFVLY